MVHHCCRVLHGCGHDPAGDHHIDARALASVPMSFREACWTWRFPLADIRTIVLPNRSRNFDCVISKSTCSRRNSTDPVTGAILYSSSIARGSAVPWPTQPFMALSFTLRIPLK